MSFAVIVEIISRDRGRWLLVAAFVLALVSLWLFPRWGAAIFSGILVLGALAAWWRRSW